MQVIAETGSTNADLLAAAAGGAPDRSVLAARHQTAGRGRLDRTWEAPPGANLLVSLLFRDVPDEPHEPTQRVALAALAVARRCGVDAAIKWPNDLLAADGKLAGILAQSQHGCVVVGVGMNVGWAPPGAAKLGGDHDPLDVLAALLLAYDDLPDDVHEAYRQHLSTLGAKVRVELPGGVVEGRAIDIEADGRLVVLDACGITHRLSTGDVVHLRRR